MKSWIDDLGIMHATMRGYSSESLEREIWEAMEEDGRPCIVGYIGDLDPEGEDIERNFLEQAARRGIDFLTGNLQGNSWGRLGVTPAQVQQYSLIANFGKPGSSRAPGFVAKYGRLFQVEIEALDPRVLKQLVLDFIAATGTTTSTTNRSGARPTTRLRLRRSGMRASKRPAPRSDHVHVREARRANGAPGALTLK
jgi:hypothetical protein